MTKHIKKVAGLSRREVLVGSAAGAGLVIGYSVLPNAVDSASNCLLYTSPSPRDATLSRMPSSA